MQDFWRQLDRPILILAPMFNVTDVAFREMFARHGAPSVFFTEFVSCNGLASAGRKKLLVDLQFTKRQRPIVAQIWGEKPENYYVAAQLCQELGFDGIDINMGCPDKAVLKQGSCGALIDNPELAEKIFQQTRRGAGRLPISVKTRLGVRRNAVVEWMERLLALQPAAITVHGRTCREMSKVPAHWDQIAKAVAVRDNQHSATLIIGNGDIQSLSEAQQKVAEFGVDGVMVGRGAFGNPWFFNSEVSAQGLPLAMKLAGLQEHTQLFERWLGKRKPFVLMRKHFASYLSGYPNAKPLKLALMETKNLPDVKRVSKEFLRQHPLAGESLPLPS